MTLEQAYSGDPETSEPLPEYDSMRAAKVAQIAAAIADDLKPGLAAESVAEWLMNRAEEMGRIRGDLIEGEIPSRYAARGNAIPLTV